MGDNLPGENMSERLKFFKRLTSNELLDRALLRPQITGIAISGIIGVGLFIRTGSIIELAGSLGSLIAYTTAGLVVVSVMLCLSEMVSIRSTPGAIFEYPQRYVDPALGFAVGVIYWLSYTTAFITSLVQASQLFGFPKPSHTAGILVLIMITIGGSNIYGGVRWYGGLEWVVKWFKLSVVMMLWVIMICVIFINSNHAKYWTNTYLFTPGYNDSGWPTAAPEVQKVTNIEIPGAWGSFLGIWTSITLAGYGYIGVEIVIIAAGEAKYPRRDLPWASRWTYLVSIFLYMVSTLLVSFNVPYNNPNLNESYTSTKGQLGNGGSPFIIAVLEKFPRKLAEVMNALFIISAWTTANTNVYVASRTLFALSSNSDIRWVRRTLGRTSLNGTPVAAIVASFCPGLLALTAVWGGKSHIAVDIFSQIATIAILCVYIAECYTFTRLRRGIRVLRDGDEYKNKYYRVPRQPSIAYFGIISCSLFILFNGWHTFVRIHKRSIPGIEAFYRLLEAYSAPILFAALFMGYKFMYRMPMTDKEQFSRDLDLDDVDNTEANSQSIELKDGSVIKRVWLRT